jgi:hypothetical protein
VNSGTGRNDNVPDIAVTTKNVLNENEQALLEALIDPRSVVTAVIPESTPAKELFSNLELCCRAYLHLEKIQRKISPIIGRILLVLQENPDKYQSHGYSTFEDFLKRFIEQKMGYSRASAYQSMRLVRKFPGLTINKWLELGTERLQILSKYTQESDPSFPKYLAVAIQAKSKNELLDWAANNKLVARGEVYTRATIINMTHSLYVVWQRFRQDSRVHSIVGSESGGLIFEAMVAECSSSWLHEDMVIEKPPVVVMGTVIGYCGLCKKEWFFPLPEKISMNELRGLMYDHHKEQSKDCEEVVSNLSILRVGAAVTE